MSPRDSQAQLDSDAMAGRRFGAWTVARLDETGRRALVVCQCGSLRQVALEALEAGDSMGCGCAATPTTRPPIRRTEFASALAASESRATRKRQFGGGL